MKIYVRLPGGGEINIEREPMSIERFQMICLLIGIFIVGHGLLEFFGMSVRH